MVKTKPVSKREEMRARAIVQRAMDHDQARQIAEKRTLIGRCFKYRNCNSGDDPWWLYAVVTGVDEYGRIAVIQFQTMAGGESSVQVDTYAGLLPHGGWMPITVAEFKAGAYEFFSSVCQALGTASKVAAVDPVGDRRTE